jgi:hypothetical protein
VQAFGCALPGQVRIMRLRLDATVVIDENSLFRESLKRILSTTCFRVAVALREVGDVKMLSLKSSSAVLVLTGGRMAKRKRVPFATWTHQAEASVSARDGAG